MTSHVLPVPRTLGASPSERYIFAYALHCKLTNLISLLTAVIVVSFCPLCSVRIFDFCFVHSRSFWVPHFIISIFLVPYLFVALGGATDALRQVGATVAFSYRRICSEGSPSRRPRARSACRAPRVCLPRYPRTQTSVGRDTRLVFPSYCGCLLSPSSVDVSQLHRPRCLGKFGCHLVILSHSSGDRELDFYLHDLFWSSLVKQHPKV